MEILENHIKSYPIHVCLHISIDTVTHVIVGSGNEKILKKDDLMTILSAWKSAALSAQDKGCPLVNTTQVLHDPMSLDTCTSHDPMSGHVMYAQQVTMK